MARKAQMFVITMVFLTGLVFSVQSLLFLYSELDLSEPVYNRNDHVIGNIRDMFQSALDSSGQCEEASKNVRELVSRLSGSIRGGQEIRALGELSCGPSGDWPPPPELTLEVSVTREDKETSARLELTRGG